MKQEYQILVEDRNGIWRELELGADSLAWTCQVNDIAVLADRNTSYSQALKLPRSAKNVEVFDYACNFDAVTDTPYRKHNCRVFCADYAISGKGSFLMLLKVSEYFECQILSGNASFFELLQGAPMSDLDLGVFQVCNKSMNPDTWHPAYKVAYGSDVVIPSYPYPGEASTVGIMYLRGVSARYPVMSVDYILQQIVSGHGYTFESNIDSWEKMYLSINSAEAEPTPDDLKSLDGEIHTNGWQPIAGSLPSVTFQWDVDNDADGNIVEYTPQNDRIIYFVPAGQKIKFTITNYAAGTTMNFQLAHFFFKRGDEVVKSGSLFSDGAAWSEEWEYENDSSVIHVLTVTATCPEEPIPGMGFTIKGEVVQGGTSNAGGKLVLSERTGFETQFDFMKFFVQAFGLTLVVDETSKKVHAYTMHLLYDNIKAGNVKDWSGKVERNPGAACSFTLTGYARENIITFEENSKDEFTDSAKFYIDNQTLDASKELLKIGVGSGKDLPVYSFDGEHNEVSEIAASIPLVELKPPAGKDEEDNPYETGYELYLSNASFPVIKPHLVELTDRTVSVRVTSAGRAAVYEYQIANHVPAGRIVDMGYSILQDKMLKHAKLIEDKFYLTPEDVEWFEPSIPVYIEKYGAYFCVNKIRNFELGKITTCELIRL